MSSFKSSPPYPFGSGHNRPSNDGRWGLELFRYVHALNLLKYSYVSTLVIKLQHRSSKWLHAFISQQLQCVFAVTSHMLAHHHKA